MKNDYVVVNAMNNYIIKEKKTGQHLISYDFATPANVLCNKLNSGSGFAGETPAFFAKKIVQVDIRKLVAGYK